MLIMVFAIRERDLEKERSDCFQVAIHFQPGHPEPKIFIYSFSVLFEQS